MSQALADDLREVMTALPPEVSGVLARWISRLQSSVDCFEQTSATRRRQFEQLFYTMALAIQLKSADKLKSAMLAVLRLTVEPDLQASILSRLERSCVSHMDPGQVSRARLCLDCAFMLLTRVQNRLVADEDRSLHAALRVFARYVTWDSSPQCSRDFQLSVVRSVPRKLLPDLLRASYELQELWVASEFADEERFCDVAELRREEQLMSFISSAFRSHQLPPSLIGFGAGSVARKVQALLHSIRLETFTSQDLQTWVEGIVTMQQDHGTEHGIMRMEPLPTRDALPYFADALPDDVAVLLGSAPCQVGSCGFRVVSPYAARADNGDESLSRNIFEDIPASMALPRKTADDVFEGIPEQIMREDDVFELVPVGGRDSEDAYVDFSGTLDPPPCHHILDNATDGLASVMVHYDACVHGARQLCKLVRGQDTQPKLLQRCFSGSDRSWAVPLIKGFRGAIFPGRWGTLVFSIPHLRNLQRCLELYFTLEGYTGTSMESNEHEGEAAKKAEDAHAFASSKLCWAWLCAIECIAGFLRRLTAWVEGCDCHWQYLENAELLSKLPEWLVGRWRHCPNSTLRCGALSSGELMRLLNELADVTGAELVMKLPADLTDAQRATVLAEFDNGRSHIILFLVTKLSHSSQAPWMLFQLGCFDKETIDTALSMLLACSSHHPLVKELQQPPLRQQAERWLHSDRSAIFDPSMVELCVFVAGLRFASISERPGDAWELLHASGLLLVRTS